MASRLYPTRACRSVARERQTCSVYRLRILRLCASLELPDQIKAAHAYLILYSRISQADILRSIGLFDRMKSHRVLPAPG